jgi:uncharacterized protein
MAQVVTAVWENIALWIPISAMIVVQLIKFFGEWMLKGYYDLEVLVRTGGMPSSHSALVTGLATVTALEYGLESPFFALASILALIVMYDARGIRQQSGQHARILNRILREMFSGQPVTEQELKELLGHTLSEVVVGGIFGIVYSFTLYSLLS